jgi:hypothetical protein
MNDPAKIVIFRVFVVVVLFLYAVPFLIAIFAAAGTLDPTARSAEFARSFLLGDRSFLSELDGLLLPIITFVSAFSYATVHDVRWTITFIALGCALILISIVGEVLYNSDDVLAALGMGVAQKNSYLQNFVALRAKMLIYVSLILGISQSRPKEEPAAPTGTQK